MEKITFFLYNTVCTVMICDERNDSRKLLEQARKIADQIREMLDFYDPDSELGRMNRMYCPDIPYPVSEELCGLIDEVLRFSRLSGGCFDPTVGPAVKLWDIPAKLPSCPDEDKIGKIKERVGAYQMECDTKKCTVTFHRKGMMFDAGGVGKGYAVDRVANFLIRSGVRHGAVNFGGNLYLIGGKNTGEELWRVGVQAPWQAYAKSCGTMMLKDCGTATSGGYDRFFIEDGNVYHHLLDPRTGHPVENTLDAVTITATDAMHADLLSTACFVAGEEKIDELCRKSGVGAEWLVVKKSGEILMSSGMKKVFRLQEKEE